MIGTLYLVATPIGNLEDITLRAINILKSADLVAAEDTRRTLKLLNHLEISKPLISYYKEIEKSKSNVLIKELLDGKNIALVSDAGTPGISDPGEEIVKKAIENNINIIPIPGACALITALIASGLDTSAFSFIGFLPVNKKEKNDILKSLLFDTKTLIFYEAPHKVIATLQSLLQVFGNRKIALGRELTKIHEEFIRGTIEEVIVGLNDPKGEYVIILEASNISKEEKITQNLNELTLEEHFKYYEDLGYSKKDSIKNISKDRNIQKNEVYKNFL